MSAERAVLITVQLDPRFARDGASWPIEDEARELAELVTSSGCRVVAEVSARRHQPIAGTFLGGGKLEEIAALVVQHQGQVVIFNHELSPAQQRNIEEAVRAKTIDRTQLILDIFAQRARSQEGKVQVELAQLRYLLPRLTGKGVMLSRLGGGIGTRGPGEQKLEVDRRRIRARITRLGRELDKLGERRQATRSRRRETELPVVALVGYTNAGKTTLLNKLTGAEGTAQNQLFTTLDPLARRLHLSTGEIVILTDTVGFLHHLPHHLIEAFKATLEEARDADILLHVLDVSHPLALEHAEAVEAVLRQLGLQEKPVVTALNKSDRIEETSRLEVIKRAYEPACIISARTGQGLPQLCELISRQLDLLLVPPVRLRIPVDRSDVLAATYQNGQVLSRRDANGVTELLARLPEPCPSLISSYVVDS